MKKKSLYYSLILTISGVAIIGGMYFSNRSKLYASELPIQDAITLKQKVNIEIKGIPQDYFEIINSNYTSTSSAITISSISEKEAIDTANIYCGNLYKTTTIKTQQNLLTDETLSIGAINKNTVDSNPILKKENKLSNIPVWLISYEGINIKRHNTTFNEQVVVVDAITGKVLYSFRYR